MQVSTVLTGPFPRPEALVQATRDLDRGRTTPEAVRELFLSAERDVSQLETRLGLEPRTGGYLRWADLFRPFAESWPGFTVGPLTRWFETNTFYRQPILHAPPERAPGAIAPWLPETVGTPGGRRGQAILPGPYTFAGSLDNRSGETFEALTHRLGRLLAEEIRELRALGYVAFQLQEPLLVTRPATGARAESIVAAYRAIGGALEGAALTVWTYFGDGAVALPLLNRLPASVIGFDLAETDLLELPPMPDRRGIGLGVIDPRTSLVEDPAEVLQLTRAVGEKHRPLRIVLGPGAPLDLLPWEPATRKLHVLPAVRQGLGASGEGRR
jgi:5-methyltetrahydropteroyltriglutamate--homocysteine methyltransferase